MSLYLGMTRISQYSYSAPQVFNQNIYFNDEEISFHPLVESKVDNEYFAQIFQDKPKLKISSLPSNTRLVI